MKRLAVLCILLSSPYLLAHPNGTYQIDGDEDVTVTFEYLNRCPSVDGAMRGGLRTLTFSELAEQEPYSFTTSYFVETHVGSEEIYIETNEQCIPIENGQEIRASRNTFGEFELQRVR